MRKFTWSLLFILMASLLLAACAVPVAAPAGGGEAAATEAPAETAGDTSAAPVRVALILPSTINDVSWSQSIYTSLKELQAEMGEDALELAYTENMWSVPDAAIAIRDYADSGYNLVIAHGAQYGDSLMDIAVDFPEVSFAWGTTTNTGADKGLTNIFAFEPRGDEAGYVTGVLAANLTKSRIIGLVGPVDAGDAKQERRRTPAPLSPRCLTWLAGKCSPAR